MVTKLFINHSFSFFSGKIGPTCVLPGYAVQVRGVFIVLSRLVLLGTSHSVEVDTFLGALIAEVANILLLASSFLSLHISSQEWLKKFS